jgi:fructose-bisphosphate aldolase/2-amino-3,7-dideoxy-D-threo-hept-6-ulosonate synthase
MFEIGKEIRLERITNRKTKRTVIVPLDHSMAYGSIKGLEDIPKIVNAVAEGGANAVVLHIGSALNGLRGYGKDIGLILHLNAGTNLAIDPERRVMVNTVQHALKLGADAVSMQLNIGSKTESEMLHDVAMVSLQCREWGVPLLVMAYPKGEYTKDDKNVKIIKHVVRTAAELGADIVKTNYTGSIESFKEVVEGCPVPVIVAGGSKADEIQTLTMIEESIKAGGAGVAMGRNSFQHENPTAFVKAVCAVVHENKTVDEAMKLLQAKKQAGIKNDMD